MQDYNNYQTQAQDMNVEQFTNDTALRIRLDTAQLLYQLQLFLEGSNERINRNESGSLIIQQKNAGKPMANEIGRQRILCLIQTIVNTSMVQGNLREDRYDWFMERFRRDLSRHLFVNLYTYEIREEEYGYICDMICNAVELYVSRTINNEERKSYTGFMTHLENTTMGQQQKKASIWSKLPFTK